MRGMARPAGSAWRPLSPHVPASAPSCSSSSSSSSSRFSSSSHTSHRLAPLSSSTARCSRQRQQAAPLRASKGDMPGSSSSGGRSSGSGAGAGGPRRSRERKARKPGLFEIKVVTPPPRSLGIYALPPHTHNGEEIEIDGQGYVVTSLELRWKLHKGRYVRDHSALEVTPTGRFFLNQMLEHLISARYMGPTGSQD